jgi:hypothetical protein
MKFREFNATLKQVSTSGLIDFNKANALPIETKKEIVSYLVRNREVIILPFLYPNADLKRLHSCGYLYTTQGRLFLFLHTSEHKVDKRTEPNFKVDTSGFMDIPNKTSKHRLCLFHKGGKKLVVYVDVDQSDNLKVCGVSSDDVDECINEIKKSIALTKEDYRGIGEKFLKDYIDKYGGSK